VSEMLSSFIELNRVEVETALQAHLPLSSLTAAQHFNAALKYALFPGGKRQRPMLSLLASELVAVPRSEGLKLGCALEFLHSSSLIIDDLPGMDDAGIRRNRRTVHLVFGDAIAMLAALALLNQSYALFAEAAQSCGGPGAVDFLILETSRVIGVEGMIGGQVVDLESRSGSADATTLARRDLKTVALMRLMMTAGAIACGRPAEDVKALSEFGECFGRAYQICDDLLDETNDIAATGKSPGQDVRHRRASSVALLGVAGARKFAEQMITQGAFRLRERFGPRAEVRMLTEAGDRVLKRAGVELAGAHVA